MHMQCCSRNTNVLLCLVGLGFVEELRSICVYCTVLFKTFSFV